MYKRIKGYYPEIINYFPEYIENSEYLPPKKYMWDVFSTRDSSMAHKFTSHSLKERNRKDSEGERMVEVSEEVLNQLHSAHFFSKKKGKALFMLSASKELGTIKRKRKKQINEYDPLGIEEEKEYKSKKQKQNEDRNKKITDWLQPKNKKNDKNEDKEKKDKIEQESNEREDMNIDLNLLRLNNPFIKK